MHCSTPVTAALLLGKITGQDFEYCLASQHVSRCGLAQPHLLRRVALFAHMLRGQAVLKVLMGKYAIWQCEWGLAQA